MSDKYNDIINTEYPFPLKHKRMSELNRAAQFAPFAALTGFENNIKEINRETSNLIELTDEEKNIISDKLGYIKNNLLNKQKVRIIYFVPDIKKQGGKYIEEETIIKKIDQINKIIILKDNTKILFKYLINIDY